MKSKGKTVSVKTGKKPAAVALGRLAGLKGQRARAEKLSAAERSNVASLNVQLGFSEVGANAEVRVPFLKWAGRKTRILPILKPLLPTDGRRLIEPFVGSGAVFLSTDYEEAVLADSNEDLIQMFEVLRRDGEKFIEACERLFRPESNQEQKFYELREEFNKCDDAKRRSALFIYLNRHCFNGLCRYNASGNFNTPFGRYDKPYFPKVEMLTFASKLRGAELRTQDFRKTLTEARRGDVVYCDPPYVPLSDTANFTAYAAGGFGAADQSELALQCIAAAGRGATVLISNHDTPFTRELYVKADALFPLMVARMISCDGAKRNKAKELIAVFHPA